MAEIKQNAAVRDSAQVQSELDSSSLSTIPGDLLDSQLQQLSDSAIFDQYQYLETDSVQAAQLREKFNSAVESRLIGSPEFKEIDSILKQANSGSSFKLLDAAGGLVALYKSDAKNINGRVEFFDQEELLNSRERALPRLVLDLDSLSKQEGKDWLPSTIAPLQISADGTRALLPLSESGGDVAHIRELDLKTGRFIEGGFEASGYGGAMYHCGGPDVLVSMNIPGIRTTVTGLPAEVHLCRPGQVPNESTVVHSVSEDLLGIGMDHIQIGPGKYATLYWDFKDYYTQDMFAQISGQDGAVIIPERSMQEYRCVTEDGFVLFSPMKDLMVDGVNCRDALVALDLRSLESGEPRYHLVYNPEDGKPVTGVSEINGNVIVSMLDNVSGAMLSIPFSRDAVERGESGAAYAKTLPLPSYGSIGEMKRLPGLGITFSWESFVEPRTQYVIGTSGEVDWSHPVAAEPATVDPGNFSVSQHWATSHDGTRVPYYEVRSRDNLTAAAPTIVYAYGGFSESITPFNISEIASGWIEQGGAYALANIRGGREFGEKWHEDGMKANRVNTFEDLIAVAKDLDARGAAAPGQVGIWGGSHGGLTVTGAMIRNPGAFGAVVSEVPVLDLERYKEFDPKAQNWEGEYGSPADSVDAQYIRRDSPYRNVNKDVDYPPVLFMAAEHDDRGGNSTHALKMACRMQNMGHDVMLYTAESGGHSSANQEQVQHERTLMLSFFKKNLR